MNKFSLLDCTLRDGGYYNNWDFDKETIQKYLYAVDSANIKFIELGFRFNDHIKNKGLTAYTEDSLLKKLKIPKNINIGIMINASDFILNNNININTLKKVLPVSISKEIKFIRVACHHSEVLKLKYFFKYFKKFKIKIFINIMQISEIKKKQLLEIINFLNPKEVSVIYLADSLGALGKIKLKEILGILKKNCNKEIGIHAHDNLNLALKNSLFALSNGVSWIDSTITGMGRGPGNLKTEEILKYSNFCKKTEKFNNILKTFLKLKKFYKWGSNIYYKMGAIKKIHPTYIQKILNDNRYKKKEYKKIINELGASDTSKFNPYKLINSAYFISNKPKGSFVPSNILKKKNILILGPGKNLLINSKKIQKIIKSKNLFVIALNTFQSLDERFINLRVSCHPFRIMSDMKKYRNLKTMIVLPYSMMAKNLKKKLKLKKNNYYDYGLQLNNKQNFVIRKNFCSLPFPLAVGYAFSLAVAGKAKSIKVAGFDGYNKSDSDKDETEEVLKYFSSKYFDHKITSLTKTKYKILRYNLNG